MTRVKSNVHSIVSGGVIRGVDNLIFTLDRKLHAFDFWLKKWQKRYNDRNKDTSAVEIFLTLIYILLVAFQSLAHVDVV